MSARDEVLARVRRAISDNGSPPPPVDRTYRTAPPAPAPPGAAPPGEPDPGRLELFVQRVEDYRATVTRCGGDDTSIGTAVRAALFSHDVRSVVTPDGLPAWVDHDGRVSDHPGLTATELDGIDAVVTGCAVAIAETGTIVLDGAPVSGRRMISLVPDLHVCVVRTEQVAGGVPEALARLDPIRPLTFVSGPSATSDIELSRVEGVHGPRTLHVVLAG